MKRALVAVVFIAWAAAAQARRGEVDCSTFRLPAQDLARIRTAARRVVDTPLDAHSTGSCRQRQQDWFEADFDTVHLPQADGSERWKRLTCRSDFRRQAPWKCEAWADTRAIRVSLANRASDIVVAIPNDMEVTLARQRVTQALALLEQPGQLRYCTYQEGNRSPDVLVEKSDDSRPLDALREDLVVGEGTLVLTLQSEGFAISRDLLFVYFQFAPPDAAAHAQCWEQDEIVVTS